MLPFEIKELTRALILECQSRKIKLTYFIKIATWEKRPIRNNFESTAQKLSFEWSYTRFSSTDAKVRTTLYSIINSTT